MEITVAKDYEYVPEWNGNKADANPIKFKMRYLTTAERGKLLRYDFNADGGVTIIPDKPALFVASVLSIENLKVNGEPLTKAREMLSKPGLDFLFLEVVANIISQNAQEEPKN